MTSFGGGSPSTDANYVNKILYALNVTKQSFISLGVTAVETQYARLLGKLRIRSNEGLWVCPARRVPGDRTEISDRCDRPRRGASGGSSGGGSGPVPAGATAAKQRQRSGAAGAEYLRIRH